MIALYVTASGDLRAKQVSNDAALCMLHLLVEAAGGTMISTPYLSSMKGA